MSKYAMGTPNVPTNPAKFAQAAMDLADVLDDGMLASQMGESFTCSEVDSLAVFLVAAGRWDGAVGWIDSHADGDDIGDGHTTGDEDDESDEESVKIDAETYLTEHLGLTK